MTEKAKPLFQDLGRATLRGILKCPKCGTFNGTRGTKCKNKNCRVVFRLPKEKPKPVLEPEIDAVRVNHSCMLQVFSIRLDLLNAVSQDTTRCFVLLPLIEGIESLQDESEAIAIKQSAATCYAPNCKKAANNNTAGSITLNLNPCCHTFALINCMLETETLSLKKAVVRFVPMPELFREQICGLLGKPEEEEIVQRVTKTTFAVVCDVDEVHPLGLLHLTILEPIKTGHKFRILCECHSPVAKPFVPKEKQMCIHFYMCITAFCSSDKFIEEFRPLIKSIFSLKSPDPSAVKLYLEDVTDPDIIELKEFLNDESPDKKRNARGGTLFNGNACSSCKLCSEYKSTLPCKHFEQWLMGVTERINQTMHYQFNGLPEPLVFQVPMEYFDIFQQRLATSNKKKKRLPNIVKGVNSKDQFPIGAHQKLIWNITNIFHVKKIFDTPQVPLQITRSFIPTGDGTYTLYEPTDDQEILENNYKKIGQNHLIKPLEFRTFLKVGKMALGQKQPVPFTVEWVPDVLPVSRHGIMMIKFQFGHERNGLVEDRENKD